MQRNQNPSKKLRNSLQIVCSTFIGRFLLYFFYDIMERTCGDTFFLSVKKYNIIADVVSRYYVIVLCYRCCYYVTMASAIRQYSVHVYLLVSHGGAVNWKSPERQPVPSAFISHTVRLDQPRPVTDIPTLSTSPPIIHLQMHRGEKIDRFSFLFQFVSFIEI